MAFLLPPPRPSYYSDRSSITDSVSNFITEQLAERSWTKEPQCWVCEAERGNRVGRKRLYGCKFCAHAVCEDCSPTRKHHASTEKEERMCNACVENWGKEEGMVERNREVERLVEERERERERFAMVIEDCLGVMSRAEGQMASQSLAKWTQVDLTTCEKGVSVRAETAEKAVLKEQISASTYTQVQMPGTEDREIQFSPNYTETASGAAFVTVIDIRQQTDFPESPRNDAEVQCDYRENPCFPCQTEEKLSVATDSQTEKVQFSEICTQSDEQVYAQIGISTLPIGLVNCEIQTCARETSAASIQTDLCPGQDRELQVCLSLSTQSISLQTDAIPTSLETVSQTELRGEESHTQTLQQVCTDSCIQTESLAIAPSTTAVVPASTQTSEEWEERRLGAIREKYEKCILETGLMREVVNSEAKRLPEMQVVETINIPANTTQRPLLCCPQMQHHVLPASLPLPAPSLHFSHSPGLTISSTAQPCSLHITQLANILIPSSAPSMVISDPTIKRKVATTSPFALAQSGEISPTTALLETYESQHCAKVTEVGGMSFSREVQTEVAAKDVDAAFAQMEEMIVRNEDLEKQVLQYRETMGSQGLAASPKDLAEDLSPEVQERLSVRFSENDTIQALLFRLKSTEKELGRLRSPINGSSTKSRPSVQPGPVTNSCKCSVF